MHIQIDLSGRIEYTSKDTAAAFSKPKTPQNGALVVWTFDECLSADFSQQFDTRSKTFLLAFLL